MKKLYVKQKVFKITDHYPIMDEFQNPVYQVDQDFKLIGNTVHVCDTTGREVFVVNKVVLTLLPKFVVSFDNGKEIELKSKFTIFKKVINVFPEELGITLQGNFIDHNFSILQDGEEIAVINKVFLAWGDTYELSIFDESKQDLVVALMIAVDCIKDDQQKRN